MWSLAGFHQGPLTSDTSLIGWLLSYLKLMSVESLPVSQRRVIPWVLWTIWKNRNKAYTEPMSGLMGENRRWDPPLTGTVKCNIHSNWRNAKLHSGGAYVIHDHRGCCVGSDLHDLINAVMRQSNWPRFRALLSRVRILCLSFPSVAFESESASSNGIAREIAKSVLRDGRFHSYLAMGGPAWLHQQIFREANLTHS
ncbi:hypothetical protein F2Q69_00019599 [Brassica cretica]|uniref:RNase H type-1 domain-containing protein n=1 Tax=Brassica cretica TaxID=69181 RepID=A0A8S9Q6R7_BRACR|nr:hypothetical protein F2Q69_00019599 [Brassica cretica]